MDIDTKSVKDFFNDSNNTMSFTATILMPWLVDKLGGKGFDLFIKRLSQKGDDIDKNFKKAIITVSAKLQEQYPSILANDIEYFFTTKDVFDELIKLLFRNSKFSIDTISSFFDSDTLPKEFIYEFVNELKKEILNNRKLNEIFSNNQVYLTILGIGDNIEKITDATSLTADEITRIRILLENQFDKNFDFGTFKKSYVESALGVLSQVNFIGLGVKSHIKKNRKKLKDIFIEPKFGVLNKEDFSLFSTTSFNKSRDPSVLFEQIFSFPKNIVILGDPGAGKSMAVRRIICAIIENDNTYSLSPEIQNSLPFRIELRKYLQFKKDKDKGIANYLSNLLETDYGVSNLTEKNIEFILNNGRLLFFFDGFDEIFNITDKIEVKNDIENFIKAYENILAVVTSRVIGYEEAKLEDSSFCELRIKDFDDAQIKNYVSKWYSQEEIDEDVRNKEVEEFLNKKHQIDPELIKNPLLLSLIVILFRNNLKLPDSKLEIYQSCTKTLVEKWDATKDLKIEITDEINRKKESLFADLAYWQYQQLSGKSINITNERVIKHLEEVIVVKHKLTDDYIQARKLAEEFISYALKRSLYFDNNFTHKTFLEYFTAYWIYSNVEKKHKTKERDAIVSKYISNPFWSIVLELLFNMIDQDQADTEMIDNIFQEQISNEKTSIPFLISILPAIKNISESEKEKLVFESLKIITANNVGPRDIESNQEELHTKIFESITFDKTFLLITERFFRDECKEDQKFIKFQIFILEYYFFNIFPDFFDKSIFFNEKYKNLLKKIPYLYVLNYFSMDNERDNYLGTSLEFISYFGPKVFFENFNGYYVRIEFGGMCGFFISRQTQLENLDNLEENFKILIENGVDEKALMTEVINRQYYHESGDGDIEILLDLIKSKNHSNDLFYRIYLTLLWKLMNQKYYKKGTKISLLQSYFNQEEVEILQLKKYDEVLEKLKFN